MAVEGLSNIPGLQSLSYTTAPSTSDSFSISRALQNAGINYVRSATQALLGDALSDDERFDIDKTGIATQAIGNALAQEIIDTSDTLSEARAKQESLRKEALRDYGTIDLYGALGFGGDDRQSGLNASQGLTQYASNDNGTRNDAGPQNGPVVSDPMSEEGKTYSDKMLEAMVGGFRNAATDNRMLTTEEGQLGIRLGEEAITLDYSLFGESGNQSTIGLGMETLSLDYSFEGYVDGFGRDLADGFAFDNYQSTLAADRSSQGIQEAIRANPAVRLVFGAFNFLNTDPSYRVGALARL